MEKMNIEPEKIIHILLKHLMDQRNEIAYLKNKAALYNDDNDLPESLVGIKPLTEGVPESLVGIKNLSDSTTEIKDGIKNLSDGTTEIKDGIKNLPGSTTEIKDGIKNLSGSTTEIKDGIKNLSGSTTEIKDGIKHSNNDVTENKVGIKSVLETLPQINVDGNGGALLYSVFEKGLIKALEHYINSDAVQNSLYKFYADFEDAVAERNSDASKIKEAMANASLEDTHSLPVAIPLERVFINRLHIALRVHLPRRAGKGVHRTVANELLLLHNAGKATGAELRGFGGLSVAGFAKHLPNLIRNGLVKKQPPSNYVLTDKSKHILLELFGVKKAE